MEAGRKIRLAEVGIRNTDERQIFTDITETSSDPEVIEAWNLAKLYGYKLHVVNGGLIRTKFGRWATGIYEDGQIVVSADDEVFSATQIANHELYHWIHSKTPGMTERLVERLKQEFSEQELNELIAAYAQLYAGLGLEDEDIFEEICADLYAGMMREQLAAARRANLPRLTEAARSIAYERSNVIPAEARSKNQTRAGPDADSAATGRGEDETKTAAGSDAGDGRYSITNTRKMSWKDQVDGYFKKTGSIKSSDSLYLGTSNIENVKDSPLYVPASVINKAVRAAKGSRSGHSLNSTDIQALKRGIENAPAVIYNPARNAIVFVTENKDANENYIIAAFDLNNDLYGENAHKATSIHGQVNLQALFENLGSDAIVYVKNEKKLNQMLPGNQILTSLELLAKVELLDSISDSAPSVNPRFSISDDTTQRLQERADEIEQQIEKTRALMGEETDPATFGELEQLRTERTAIYSELDDRLRREARKAARDNDEQRTAALEEIRFVEDHAKELSREANAERAAYKADGNADHLVNAERLRGEAAAERKKGAALRKEAGVDGAPKYRPIESMRQTSNRILDLFRIQAGSRAGMRAGINTVLNRTLTQGYVTESDLESLLRTMYEAGVDVVPADTAYEDVAKTLRGKTLYVSEEVRREFGDDWQAMRKALFGVGIYTSSSMTENSTAIDRLYTELAEDYPGLFDSEQTDMRAMLEDMQEAAALGKVTHRSLAESAAEIGLSSEEDFAALYGEVVAELRSFADRAGLEMRMRGEAEQRQEQSLVKLRQHYTDVARRAAQRRQRSEQMTKIRNAIKRLNRAAERNSETLNKVISQQSPQLQQLARRAMDELDTVANRLTGKKRISLLELQQVYNDRKANDPNFIPNPATEKALALVGMVHLNDMSVEDLQALYDAVTRIEHDFNTANVLIGEAMDQQLDNAGMEIQEEIEYAKGSDASGDFAYWMNEASLSPSRALLRLVGYDRSGTMGRLVDFILCQYFVTQRTVTIVNTLIDIDTMSTVRAMTNQCLSSFSDASDYRFFNQ